MDDTRDPAQIAARLRDLDVSGPLESVREASAGFQTSAAALWLSTRIAAAVETYADRLDALSPETPDDAEEGVA